MPQGQLFLDMDGVLADFDEGYARAFGTPASKEKDNVDWEKVKNRRDFYADLPPMRGLPMLWAFCAPWAPVILTGIPSNVPEALENKRAWVTKHLGSGVKMIGCKSSEKWTHGQAGDTLVDDWEKYRHLWESMGGRWVTFTGAEAAIATLQAMGYY